MQNIQIARNRIRNMGFCGIGPVGFFDLATTLEVISIENLAITDNVISGTLQDVADALDFGYGAVAIPDVQNLIVRDNVITDFGSRAGAQVCGIYVLMGELVEISGNQILETRDWSADPSGDHILAQAVQAGIMVAGHAARAHPGGGRSRLGVLGHAAAASWYPAALPARRSRRCAWKTTWSASPSGSPSTPPATVPSPSSATTSLPAARSPPARSDRVRPCARSPC